MPGTFWCFCIYAKLVQYRETCKTYIANLEIIKKNTKRLALRCRNQEVSK